ncbi:hypothetical protein LEN26_018636 [Aphanomyces euteiches]|nr:hypothetical protein LEN26_018636 [Aphanomyces euteiches]KAH9127122.1 hypothetical protein AeMF1_002532 [Aphanomyces euteiches]KAH9181727.1 hypothetical protein AeNC1_016297 [Aphanomyces euteiches]
MARSKRQTYTIEVKREVIALLEDHSDYEVSKLMNIPRRTIRGIAAMKFEVMAYEGNRLNKKITNAKREVFPDPEGFVAFMTKMRNEEKALSCVHNINWIKKHHHSWLLDQVATSRSLLQAARKPPRMPISRDTKSGKVAYLYYNFSPATHKSLGLVTDQVKYRNSRAFKGSNPGKSRLSAASYGSEPKKIRVKVLRTSCKLPLIEEQSRLLSAQSSVAWKDKRTFILNLLVRL